MPSQQAIDTVAQIREHIVVQQLRMKPMPVQGARESFDSFAQWIPCPADVKVEKVDANGAKAEWIVAPGAATDRALLYLHGGCFVIGSAESHRETCARISAATDGAVLLVDYRRTPEDPCPAAIEDAVSGFNWLVEKKGIPASRIVIAGESAGGNLTLTAMIVLRDRKQKLPAAGVLFSPWVDLECTGKDPEIPDEILRRPDLRYLACYYLGDLPPRDPMASPLYADLRGLPPLYIHVGSAEVLLDDSHRLVDVARKAGVEVKFDVWDGLFHAFLLYPLPESADAFQRMAKFIRERIA